MAHQTQKQSPQIAAGGVWGVYGDTGVGHFLVAGCQGHPALSFAELSEFETFRVLWPYGQLHEAC
jgi:hypothetical protein